MTELALAQYALGISVGLGAWFVVYLSNRAWLAFWYFAR